MSKLAEIRKAVTAMVGLAGVGLSVGLIPSPESTWITAIIGILSALGVYAIPNKKKVTANGAKPPPTYKAS